MKRRILRGVAMLLLALGAATGAAGVFLVWLYLAPSEDPHGGIFVILPAFVALLLSGGFTLAGLRALRSYRQA